MKGTEKYAHLFKTGQYGRFYIVSGHHARGNTFHIQLLPDGEQAIPNGSNNLCTNKDAVEIYGITGGQPGWTETYGWLHKGKWIEDFQKLAAGLQWDIECAELERQQQIKQQQENESDKIKRLLSNY